MIYANDNDPELPPSSPASKSPKYGMSEPVIHLGDCLEVMRTMPSKSVDMVFTSPPYNLCLSADGKGKNNSLTNGKWKSAGLANGYGEYDDARDPADYKAWQHEVLTECWRLLKDDGAIFYNHKPRIMKGEVVLPTIYNPGLPLRQIVVWNRRQGFNFSQSFYLPCHEWVMILAKPDFRLKSKAASGAKDVWTIDHDRKNSHPAPFPVELPMTAIETTSAQVILDPFCGSGTTGVACARLGRQFIGIELDPKFHAMATQRIEAERLISLAA
jgi:site-specific DNA-methyltransferase (adenine-specific)